MSAKTRLIFEGDNRTDRAFRGINASLARLGGGLVRATARAGAFAAVIGGGLFARATAQNVAFADSVGKLATKFQTTSEEISTLAFAADRAGFTIETLDKGLRRISVTTEEGKRNLKDQAAAFVRLRIDAQKFGEISLTDQLKVLAEQFKRLEGTERIDIADAIFGGRGVSFLQLLDGGAAGIEELTAQAREFGAVISGDTARAAEESQDALTNLSSSFRGLTLALANPERLELLTTVLNGLARVLGREVTPEVEKTTATFRKLKSEGGEAVTVFDNVASSAEKAGATIADVLLKTAPKINPTVQILPPPEELREQFSPLQATLANAVTSGAEEGATGVRGVFARMLQDLFADLAASSFLQLLGSLLPGLTGGASAGGLGAIGAFLGFDSGGVVPGPRGSAQLAVVHGGETILPTHKGGVSSGGNVYNIDARGASPGTATAIRMAIDQAQAQTTRSILDLKRRGRFK